MAKRSDTLETVLLAIELLRRIPRGRKVTASELHGQLKDAGIERDLRTIQRQLGMLSEHFEIERDAVAGSTEVDVGSEGHTHLALLDRLSVQTDLLTTGVEHRVGAVRLVVGVEEHRARSGGQILGAERVPYDGGNITRVKYLDDRGRVRYMDDPGAPERRAPRRSDNGEP